MASFVLREGILWYESNSQSLKKAICQKGMNNSVLTVHLKNSYENMLGGCERLTLAGTKPCRIAPTVGASVLCGFVLKT